MEIYILDDILRRTSVFDVFESMIWTERWAASGDFELVIDSTYGTRKQFTVGTRLAINESYRVMTIETVEDSVDDSNRALLTIKGRSLEALLDDRVARYAMTNLEDDPNWTLLGLPATIAQTMFDHVCVDGALDIGDTIPFLLPGTIFAAGTIPAPSDMIAWEQPPESLYSAIKTLCELYDLGFRIVRNFDTSQLYFDIYTGSDRTTQQITLPPVVFSPELENLQNTTEYRSISGAKNVAYVFSNQGAEIVYAPNVDTDVEGFERRVLVVKADNLPDVGGLPPDASDVTAYLVQKGLEELTMHRSLSALDGEIDQNSAYKYGVHYNLGDLIEIRDGDGVAQSMRVTEQIFVSDGEGERSYPTLAINLFINPGSWLAWPYSQVWEDLGLTEYWADQL